MVFGRQHGCLILHKTQLLVVIHQHQLLQIMEFNMISFFKILSVWIFLFLLSCNINFSPRETDGFTPEAQVFVDMIMEENPGASYDVNIVEAASSFGFINPVGY